MTSLTGFRMLLIDDDEALARMLSEYLSSYGLAVDWAIDAERGREASRRTASRGGGPGRDGGARIQVLDRGAGVAEEDRERIFEPFYSSPRVGDKGVGLGLALVRRIARYHGGEAVCLARPGGGSLFEVELAFK